MLEKAFNVETITQGQAVARLNALALIFLPLSFAAVRRNHSLFKLLLYNSRVSGLTLNIVHFWNDNLDS